MRSILSEQQLAFFRNYGFIELEIPHEVPFSEKRDQWRENTPLLRFIKKELGRTALDISGKKQLKIGTSFWVKKESKPQKGSPIQTMVSLQDPQICCVMSPDPQAPGKKASLGLLPVPSDSQNVLFFDPKFILDWAHVQSDLFFVLFVRSNSVYVENKNDPETNYLKEIGYFFGDQLKNDTHPLIF